MNDPMNINLVTDSHERIVAFDVGSNHFSYSTAAAKTSGKDIQSTEVGMWKDMSMGSSTKAASYQGRQVAVQVNSDATSVTLSLKPAVLEREERQNRINASVKLGYLPPKRSTAR